MHRTIWPTLLLGLASSFPFASANFGFTSANFDYVQLSSPQVISWNGQSGEIALRLMVYPSDQELSYLPIAANLSGNSYTWLPTSLAPGSRWTLEGVDGGGNIAASQGFFTIQGMLAPGAVTASTSFLQQNPQSTAQPTTLATAAATTTSQSTSTPEPTRTATPQQTSNNSISTSIKIAVAISVGLGVAGIVTLTTFFILRYRQQKGRSLAWNPFRSKRRSRSSLPFEMQDNDSMETLPKPMELQGSRIEGTSETSWGERMELGFNASSRKSVGQRVSIAPGAVETSMGKRAELG